MALEEIQAGHFDGGQNLSRGHRDGINDSDTLLEEYLGKFKAGRVVAAGAGDESVAFTTAFADADYTVIATFEDTAGGAAAATYYVKDATKLAAGFDLTVSAAGTYHWVAIHD